MFARLTYTKILPQYKALHRKIFNEEVVPIVRQQKGLIHIMLLEPTEGDEIISVTEWQTRKDAEAYEKTGVYRQLVSKINGLTAKEPVLKTYSIEAVGALRPAAENSLY